MSTLQDRQRELREILTDPDINRTRTEGLKFVYHWYMYERARILRGKYARRMNKYAKLANDDHDVFMFRKEINNL